MDNLTHGLVGYAIYKLTAPAQPVDERAERGLKWATIVAAELPDADMLSAFFGAGTNLMWHRTYTHSLPGLVLLSGLVALVACRLWPKLPRGRVFATTLTAGFSHSFLDLLTTYGTKFLMPWSQTRYGWDILPIIDPFLLILLAAFVWAGWRYKSKLVLWGLVVAMVLFVGWRVHTHDAALAQVRAKLPSATSVAIMPQIGSVSDFRFAARTPEGFTCGNVNARGEVAPDVFIADITDHPAVAAAAATRTMSVLGDFARFSAYRLERENDLYRLSAFDPRWAMPGRTMFVGNVWLDAGLGVVREEIRQRQ
jgi:inner membrane protein